MKIVSHIAVMYKLLSTLLLGVIFLSISTNVSAQKKEGNVIEGVAMTLFGLGLAAMEVERLHEILELEAFKQVAETRPEENSCQVKVLSTSIKKLSDLSPNTAIAFGVKFSNPVTAETTSKEILLMITAPGWVNQYGVDYTLLQWLWIDEAKWLSIKGSLLELISPIVMEDGVIRLYQEVEESESADITIQKGIDEDSYINYAATAGSTTLDGLRLWRRGFKHRASNLVVPSYFMKGDDYLFSPYNDEFSLVWNEKSLGLLLNSPARFLQISRMDLAMIEAFVDGMDGKEALPMTIVDVNGKEGYVLEESSKVALGAKGWIVNKAVSPDRWGVSVVGLAIATNKWSVGDSTLYLDSRQPISGKVVMTDYDYSPPVLEFEYWDGDEQQTRKLAMDNKKLFLRKSSCRWNDGQSMMKLRYDWDGSETWISPKDELVVLEVID